MQVKISCYCIMALLMFTDCIKRDCSEQHRSRHSRSNLRTENVGSSKMQGPDNSSTKWWSRKCGKKTIGWKMQEWKIWGQQCIITAFLAALCELWVDALCMNGNLTHPTQLMYVVMLQCTLVWSTVEETTLSCLSDEALCVFLATSVRTVGNVW